MHWAVYWLAIAPRPSRSQLPFVRQFVRIISVVIRVAASAFQALVIVMSWLTMVASGRGVVIVVMGIPNPVMTDQRVRLELDNAGVVSERAPGEIGRFARVKPFRVTSYAATSSITTVMVQSMRTRTVMVMDSVVAAATAVMM